MKELATVRISFHPDQRQVLKFNVNLGALRQRPYGEEVSVWFKDHSIKNNGTFYTDSNSLEMVRRQIKN